MKSFLSTQNEVLSNKETRSTNRTFSAPLMTATHTMAQVSWINKQHENNTLFNSVSSVESDTKQQNYKSQVTKTAQRSQSHDSALPPTSHAINDLNSLFVPVSTQHSLFGNNNCNGCFENDIDYIETSNYNKSSNNGMNFGNYKSGLKLQSMHCENNTFDKDYSFDDSDELEYSNQLRVKSVDTIGNIKGITGFSQRQFSSNFNKKFTLNNVVSDDSDDTEDDDDFSMEEVFVPAKIVNNNNITDKIQNQNYFDPNLNCTFGIVQITPVYYNQYTSFTTDTNPQNTLIFLKEICYQYAFSYDNINNINNTEINDFSKEIIINELNTHTYEIQGFIYIKYKPIYFTISVWKDNNNTNKTRIEFNKLRGEAILFQKFYSEALELIYNKLDNIDEAVRCPNFEEFFMPDNNILDFDDSENNTLKYSNNDLKYWTKLLKDDYRNDSIDTLAILNNELEKESLNLNENNYNNNNNNNHNDSLNLHLIIGFTLLVARNEELIKVVFFNILGHMDECHVRNGLCLLNLILINIKNVKSSNINVENIFKVWPKWTKMDLILQRLLKHKSNSIKNHSVQVLSELGRYFA